MKNEPIGGVSPRLCRKRAVGVGLRMSLGQRMGPRMVLGMGLGMWLGAVDGASVNPRDGLGMMRGIAVEML